jgi:putative acetyltransferase
MHIRDFRIGDEAALYAVFHSSVHRVASRDYRPDQLDAWAPEGMEPAFWASRMQAIRPFVVEDAEQIVAYADVQPDGCIDHFFVSAARARQGLGTRLMNHLHETAKAREIPVLASEVSRTAQPFFRRFGFVIVERRSPVVRGVVVPNALMRKVLAARPGDRSNR